MGSAADGGEGRAGGLGTGARGASAAGETAGRTGAAEQARHWLYPGLPGVDLLRARYVRKTFLRHTHEGYVIAAISHGIEGFRHGGSDRYAGPGGLALINPDTPHTGFAKEPQGWRYGALYPAADIVASIAAETTRLRGTPGFVSPVLDDAYTARLVHEVLRAADEDNALAADTLLRTLVTRLMRLNGGPLPQRTVRGAGASAAARARAVLLERMADPPSLRLLAEEVGTGPFALLRAFKEAYGLPPHAWLTDRRVHVAKELLAAGHTPARAAAEVGFSDQPHLNRHFSRIVGVPPGAYRSERMTSARTYKTPGGPPP
ncbi:AraC family transcriptional regulator [Streptomyces sp. NBC_01497]|uniref:AraC family transcriptional regulator n=1 Tax=Streptomyces sp. NBC_01497 TaxID=2903885 RepID=UPI002E3475C0|nr:AraC family transcriptional regulator [Streptomyces sp. NBC_01497]